MSIFAYALSAFTNRPVVDETELKGDYKVALDINADTKFAMNLNMARVAVLLLRRTTVLIA